MQASFLGLSAFDAAIGGCSDSELIAVVLATDAPQADAISAEKLLTLALELSTIPFERRRALGAAGLCRLYHLGESAAKRLAALWELAQRWAPDARPQITTPRDAVLLMDELRRAPQERMMVLMLDARRRLLGTELVALGGLNVARLLPRDVFAAPLRAGAVSIIVAHNHPSGEANPSPADRTLTAALRGAGEVLGVPLLDHVILAGGEHFSFRDDGDWDSAAAA